MEQAVFRQSTIIYSVVICLVAVNWPSECFAQPEEERSTQTAERPDSSFGLFVEPTQIKYLFAFGMAYQIDPAEFPAVNQIRDVLESPESDLKEAEQLCRDALRDQPSDAGQLMLVAILSDREQNDEALKLLTELIERDDQNWQALLARGQVRIKTGDTDGGIADNEAASAIMQTVMLYDWQDDPLFDGDLFEDLDFSLPDFGISMPNSSEWLAGYVGFFVIACFLLCLRWGLRQKREASGTWLQLVGVSAFVTALWTIPVASAAVIIGTGTGYSPSWIWWAFIGIFAFFFIRGTMKPPNLTYVGKEALPECSNPEMLARIDRLSKSIGVATPTVRTQRAIHDARDSAAAFVGGLAPHSIVLYDTILSQLREDEQDAIIGHELGHVANRSIWVYSAVFPLTMTAMIVFAFLGGGFFGVLAGSALRAGLFRLMSRRFEYDCDRRAALATSPDAVARGLRRIYASHVLGKAGLLSDIVHSTATHPSLNERIHAMDKLASSTAPDTLPSVSIPYDNDRVVLCRKLVVIFAILWFCLTAYGITTTLMLGDSLWPMLALFAAVFGPTFFIMLASRRALKISKARMIGRRRWANATLRQKVGVFSLAGSLGLGCFLWLNPWLFESNLTESAMPLRLVSDAVMLVLVGGILFGFSGRKLDAYAGQRSKLAQPITAAVQRNDFETVIEICKENYDVVKHDKQLRYSGAAALLATRQLEKFIPYAEQIREEFPHFPPPAISLATTYLDQDEPEKALGRIRCIEKDLHKADPLPSIMASRALLALGRIDEAKAACARGLELAPDDVSSMAQAARVAMAAEEQDESDRLIQQGSDLLPAEPLLIVARGERAILDNDQAALQTERDALAAALEGDRLLCLYSSLAQFDEALGTSAADEA